MFRQMFEAYERNSKAEREDLLRRGPGDLEKAVEGRVEELKLWAGTGQEKRETRAGWGVGMPLESSSGYQVQLQKRAGRWQSAATLLYFFSRTVAESAM